MAFMAKSGRKRTYYVVRTLLHISIDRLVPVADLISPNLRSSGFPGKPGQEFSPKIAYFWRSKMFLQVCTVGLGYKNSASHVCMIENFKFDHGFCNNFCNNWAKIRQCGMWIISPNKTLFIGYIILANSFAKKLKFSKKSGILRKLGNIFLKY